MNEGEGEVTNSDDDDSLRSSSYLSQIFLIAIPLVSAPFAFIVGGKYGDTSSLGLENLLIGFLSVEFFILFLFNQNFITIQPIFDNSEPVLEIVILNLSCTNCNNEFETEEKEPGTEVYCPRCGFSSTLDRSSLGNSD